MQMLCMQQWFKQYHSTVAAHGGSAAAAAASVKQQQQRESPDISASVSGVLIGSLGRSNHSTQLQPSPMEQPAVRCIPQPTRAGTAAAHLYIDSHVYTSSSRCLAFNLFNRCFALQEKLHLAFVDPAARFYPSEGLHGWGHCTGSACNATTPPEVGAAIVATCQWQETDVLEAADQRKPNQSCNGTSVRNGCQTVM
jgi:hypothetical protein